MRNSAAVIMSCGGVMLDFELMKYCYGCGACVNACPRSAIQMVQTTDGSCIPKIDQAQCINCGKCDQVCIHQHTDRYHSILAGEGCYAAYELDKVERKESASGGMFFCLQRKSCDRMVMYAVAFGMGRWMQSTSFPIKP